MLKQAMFKRDWLKKKATKSGTSEDWEAYRTQRNLVNKEIKLTKKNFYQRETTEASGNQRAAWKIIKQLIGKETGSTKLIIELKNDSGCNVTEPWPGDVANSLNSYFTAIGPKLASEFFSGANNIVPEDYLTRIKSSFTLKEVKPAIVLELLNAVKISKATGHDGISNRILKIAVPFIHKKLTDIFNLSIVSDDIPL